MIKAQKDIAKEYRITCYNVETNPKSKRFGQTCKRFIAERNRKGELAGKFHCHCGADYEIINGKMNMIDWEDKRKKRFSSERLSPKTII